MKLLSLLSMILVLVFASCSTVKKQLTAKTWKADEISIRFKDGDTVYYKNGSVGKLYDTDSIRFNADYTGLYYYEDKTYSLAWHFTNSAKNKMKIVIAYSNPVTIYWDNIRVNGDFVKYTQYTTDGVIYLATGTRVPNKNSPEKAGVQF